jgi:hypothetical protein
MFNSNVRFCTSADKNSENHAYTRPLLVVVFPAVDGFFFKIHVTNIYFSSEVQSTFCMRNHLDEVRQNQHILCQVYHTYR